ncbi:glycosyl hydrolase family 76-domain-containing protein [Aspergillus bertholletiae]|uniref:Mannan endo-1,6-alpha-mannosidase n=1 Tax=Aspergillus bertholletiae TaxID=1226010 RepID=A0A5N7APU8_9EURO|nr:glycosyl hydrolase family 76-domain-containing protein [Aspergillus bertholletiae]
MVQGMKWLNGAALVYWGVQLLRTVKAFSVDVTSEQSIKDAASTAAYGMMHYYHGNESGQIPGKLPDTWWEGGAMFMTLIEYWHFTGDSTYNDEVSEGMQWQAGDGDYMPSNWSSYLGNDDQMFWGLAAMTAAELQFPEVSDGFSWLSLAQGVFNTQIKRWDTSSCAGGMRWQIYTYEAGYRMKNAISNGGLFQLAARLARYTYNETYADWAEKLWDWSASTPLLNTNTWNVADSTDVDDNCTSQGNTQWTYNYGAYIGGAAYMYNYTNGSTTWLNAVNGLLNSTFDGFFPTRYGGNIMSDYTCETTQVCNNNEIIFKGLLSMWLAFTALLVPSTYSTIVPKLQGSGVAAAETCTGYSNNSCGVVWYNSTWDGWNGLEEQMSVTSILAANMIGLNTSGAPVTSTTGGNSTSNPSAGESDDSGSSSTTTKVTTGDVVGASILTVVLVAIPIAMVVLLIFT